MDTQIKQVPILLRVTIETHSQKERNVEDQACGFMPSTTNTSTGKHPTIEPGTHGTHPH